MMKETNLTVIIAMFLVSMINAARIPIAGIFDPFESDTKSETIDDISSNQTHSNGSLPSLDTIHDHRHQLAASNETQPTFNETESKPSGPSLELIDSHSHSHDDDNASAVDTAKRFLIQPSIDFLDAQLHSGDEHAHEEKNQTNRTAADLNDFQRWLSEQNQTDQLNRFLLLQKDMKRFDLQDTQNLTDKLNRTIEELKTVVKAKQRRRYEL